MRTFLPTRLTPVLVAAALTLGMSVLPTPPAHAETSDGCNGNTCQVVIHSDTYIASWEASADNGSGWSCHTFEFFVNGVWTDSVADCGYGEVTVSGPVGSVPAGSQLCVDATNASGYPCLRI